MRATQARPSAEQTEATRLRLTFLTLLVVSLFVLLFARLWFLQVMAGERYAALAEGNAVRTISIEAPRGEILDRDGEPLVRNRHANVVSVQPSEMGERQDMIMSDLADLLGIPLAELEGRIERSRVSPFRPKPVAVDVPIEIVLYLHENASTRFPGVYAERLPLREYPHGTLAAHVVGYLGEISPEELEQETYADYRPGDLIGWAGVERTYESVLRGSEGVRRLEVDARGRVLRDLEQTLPVPGADLRLTLDVDIQQLAEEALAEGIAVARTVRDVEDGPGRGGTFAAPGGAVVVMDPSNGAVLALASSPEFEPGRFVGGVSRDYWAWLQDPGNAFPLINRAVQSSYPPGSVFKIVSAAAALEYGYMEPGDRLPCPGAWEFGGNTFRNWRRADSGHLTLLESIVQSCDTVFYELARQMWTDEQRQLGEDGWDPEGDNTVFERLTEMSYAFGLGEITGIDLPGERGGVVPGREWKHEFWQRHHDNYCTQAQRLEEGTYAQQLYSELCEFGYRWFGGDAVNMSIGQGDVQSTPLQIANAFAAIANGGTLYRPHVAAEIIHPDGTTTRVEPEIIGTLPVEPAHLDYIRQGLEGVTGPGGTAESVFSGFAVPIAGKTGTAEIKPKQPYAWFAAYGPTDQPRYVVVALVEEGGGGSQTAAPIVRRILEGLLGLEQTDIDPGVATD